MSSSSKLLQDAVNAFSRLPGIGRKSAMRMALHLLKKDRDQVIEQLINPVSKLLSDIKFCQTCNNISDHDQCNVCLTRLGKSRTICVVETIRDVMAIEDTGQYNGLYYVLGGLISPLDGIGAEELNIDKLIERVKAEEISELIMALSPTIEGETTIYYINKCLRDVNIRVSQLARGISFGGELEYTDEFTLGKSIASRTLYDMSRH